MGLFPGIQVIRESRDVVNKSFNALLEIFSTYPASDEDVIEK